MQIYEGIWEETIKYNNIEVKMKTVSKLIKEPENTNWFIEFINSKYANVTMMRWKSIQIQLELIGLDAKSIAKRAFEEEGSNQASENKLKIRLNELFNRRNSIAHQFDRQHSNAEKIEISRAIVEGFIEDIKKIIYAVHEEAVNKD